MSGERRCRVERDCVRTFAPSSRSIATTATGSVAEARRDAHADEHRGEGERHRLSDNLAENVEVDRVRRFEKQRGQED
eukprot:1805556-Prymnesium_polylepis.1